MFCKNKINKENNMNYGYNMGYYSEMNDSVIVFKIGGG